MPSLLDKRVEHKYREGLCCGLPIELHRQRNRRTDTRGSGERIRVKESRETICVDGEGENDDNGIHHYTLLAASDATGEKRWSVTAISLSTKQCFDLLLSLPSGSRKVSFSFDYDINMMLRDLPVDKLRRLHEKGFVFWHGYRIQWIPRKQFSLSLKRPEKLGGTKKCVVWDMFGYFQKSFSRTLHEWVVGTNEERKLVADMKAKRSVFNETDKERIKEYCLLECKLGAQVFDKLLSACEDAGLHLQRYDGAGSVAAAMLRKHGITEYKSETLPVDIALKGYFGGRFDHTRYGRIGDGYEYDINSAYPNIARTLPCLSHGEWNYTTQYNSNAIGIWHCRWNIPAGARWSPFPYRTKSNVGYWRNGSGWYWSPEVSSALHLYPSGIEVMEGYVLSRGCEHRPFQFIEHYFQERKTLKAKGDLAQIVLKLGLNSIYGKTAQSKGKYIPPYQSFVWAGMITSGTRAMLLDAIRLAGDEDAVLTATDAIISTKRLPLTVGDELGEWEYKVCKNLFIVQNGVYESVGNKIATRGFAPADLSFGSIRAQAAKESRFDVQVKERRFIGLGEALARVPTLRGWRIWEDGVSRVRYGYYPERIVEGTSLYLRENPCTEDSAPFTPKISTNVGTSIGTNPLALVAA